jgi:hypothetical protein
MSITSMVLGGSMQGGGAPVAQPVSSFVNAVIAFIPGDVLTVYVSAQAAIRGAVQATNNGANAAATSSGTAPSKGTPPASSAPTGTPTATAPTGSATSTVVPTPTSNSPVAPSAAQSGPSASRTTNGATSQQPVYPDWATHDAQGVFWGTIVLVVIWVLGLQFLAAKSRNQPFVLPWWKLSAGIVAFVVYAFGVDTIWLNPPSGKPSLSIAITLGIMLVSPLLAFFNQIIAAIAPTQAVVS